MLARVLSAAVNGIEAFPVELEFNCGWGETIIVLILSISPIAKLVLVLQEIQPFSITEMREARHLYALAIWLRFNADAGIYEMAFRVAVLPRQG
jgi:hypothetical protein